MQHAPAVVMMEKGSLGVVEWPAFDFIRLKPYGTRMEEPTETAETPPPEVCDKTQSTGKGFSWKKLLKVLGVLVLIFVVFCALIFNQAREKARRINCAGNLKCMALGIIIYAGDDAEHGFFPSGTTFKLLDDGSYVTNGKIYSCPSAEVPSTLASVSNYQYFGDGICDSIHNADQVPLSADKDTNHKDWYNVAFVDGHCRGYHAPDWGTLVKRQGWDKLWEAAREECQNRSHNPQ